MATGTGEDRVVSPRYTKYALDAVGFARDLLGWNPDEKQAMVLSTNARRVILNCARQWGKTTVAATKIVHMTVMRPRVVVLIVSENLSQTGELFRKIEDFLAVLGLKTKGEPGKRLGRRLENGSRIIGIAAREAAGRGYTADLVFLDEAARIADEVIDAFKPTIGVKGGDWWMASTPRGRRGRFFELWTYGEGSDLLKVCAPASENPRLDPKFVEQCRKEYGEDYVRQEFGCEFVESGTYLMSLDQIDGLIPRNQ